MHQKTVSYIFQPMEGVLTEKNGHEGLRYTFCVLLCEGWTGTQLYSRTSMSLPRPNHGRGTEGCLWLGFYELTSRSFRLQGFGVAALTNLRAV